MSQLQRALVWRRLDEPGAEYFALSSGDEGWGLEGTVVVALDGRPLGVRYHVQCDTDWRTRSVTVEVLAGTEERALSLTTDDEQRWWTAGRELPHLRGCLDVDLGVTPATNTLPIRRLALSVGDSREIVAAWVRFPTLAVEALPQRYSRLAHRLYRYESGNGAFTAELEVDDLGLVTRYNGGWERVAPSDGNAAADP